MSESEEWIPPMQRKKNFKTPKRARLIASKYKDELEALRELKNKLGGEEKALQNKIYAKRLKRNQERSKEYARIIKRSKDDTIKVYK